jgi:hypothetical protein
VRRAAGASIEAPRAELEDTVTTLAAQENGLPDRWKAGSKRDRVWI